MYRKVWIIVISVILILTLSARVSLAESNDSTWNLQDPLILIYFTRGQNVEGFDEKFREELAKTLPMNISGRRSLEALYKGLQRFMDSNTIFLIHPKDIKYLQDLEAEYPNLLPLSCSKLKSYPFPLLYFSRNAETDRIRGVIIADKVTTSLAKLLTEDTLLLDIPVLLEYKNGQLKKK